MSEFFSFTTMNRLETRLKAAMAMMGLLEENLRLPLVPVQEKTRTRMREILTELGLLKESHVVA